MRGMGFGLAVVGLVVVGLAVVGLVAAGGVVVMRLPRTDSTAGAVSPAAEARLIEATEAALRGRMRQSGELRFGTMEVFQFGPADERAVCGTVRPAAGGADSAFVMRLLLPRSESLPGLAPRYQTVLEQGPGLPHAATQAAERYCHDQSTTPAVDAATNVAAPPLAFSGASATPAPATSGGGSPALILPEKILVVRSPARLRSAPGGDVQRIAAAGEVLAVIGRAPGGWVQVESNGTPGWVHGSLLSTVP